MTPHARAMPHPDPEAARVVVTPEAVAKHIRPPMYPGGPAAPVRPKEDGMTMSDRKFRDSAKWGVVGIIAFAIVVVAFKWGPPSVSVEAPDRWTGTDQIRFEAANNERLAKMDRVLESNSAANTLLANMLSKQESKIDRLTELVAAQADRIKALEEWQRGPRAPAGNTPK